MFRRGARRSNNLGGDLRIAGGHPEQHARAFERRLIEAADAFGGGRIRLYGSLGMRAGDHVEPAREIAHIARPADRDG